MGKNSNAIAELSQRLMEERARIDEETRRAAIDLPENWREINKQRQLFTLTPLPPPDKLVYPSGRERRTYGGACTADGNAGFAEAIPPAPDQLDDKVDQVKDEARTRCGVCGTQDPNAGFVRLHINDNDTGMPFCIDCWNEQRPAVFSPHSARRKPGETKETFRPVQGVLDKARRKVIEKLNKELREQFVFLTPNERRAAMGRGPVEGGGWMGLPQNPPGLFDDDAKAPAGGTWRERLNQVSINEQRKAAANQVSSDGWSAFFDLCELLTRGVHEITFRIYQDDVACFLHGPWAGIPAAGRGADMTVAFQRAAQVARKCLDYMEREKNEGFTEEERHG